MISKTSIDSLEKIVDSLSALPVKVISFNICGLCLRSEENEEVISPQLAAKSFEKIYEYSKSKGVIALLSTPMPPCFFEDKTRDELLSKRLVSGDPCPLAHGKSFVIDYEGDILPCTHMSGFP